MANRTTSCPIISVLMSCYNSSEWIGDAIKSVLLQTYKNFEFVIINDGSDDNTLDIISNFSQHDDRIKIIDKKNTGLTDSLNLGISECIGKWIARIDSDDICQPARLGEQIALAESDSKLVLVASSCQTKNIDNLSVSIHHYPATDNCLKKNLVNGARFPAHSSIMFKTEKIRMLGGYRARFEKSQDRDLWLRLANLGKFACIKKPLVTIRKHENQISNQNQGMDQNLYAMIALVSYHLRKNGYIDPVESSNEKFELFKNWIEVQLERRGFFALLKKKALLKKNIGLLGACKSSRFKFIALLGSSFKLSISYFCSRINTTFVPSMLVKDWITFNKN